MYKIEPLEVSIARVKAMSGGPVILLDYYDNSAAVNRDDAVGMGLITPFVPGNYAMSIRSGNQDR